MDTTDCLGLPFPECDPPLTKDASDIIQFKALADATDAAVQTYVNALNDTLINPPYVRMSGGSNTAGALVTHTFNVTDFDNGGLADSAADVIRIQEDGWYMIGGFVAISFAPQTPFFMRAEPLLNGDFFSSRQGPAYTYNVSEPLSWVDVGFFRAGDALNFMTQQTGSTVNVHNYITSMWALQVLANV